MRQAIDRYILAKRAENAAPNTIRAYQTDLIDLSNFVGPSQTPDRLSKEIVRVFLSLLHRNGITKTTAVRKLAALKSFSEWLRNEEVPDDDTHQKIALITPQAAGHLARCTQPGGDANFARWRVSDSVPGTRPAYPRTSVCLGAESIGGCQHQA
jgi:site-specific recombinase XerD